MSDGFWSDPASEEHRAFLRAVRARLEEPELDGASEQALVARILARTTRRRALARLASGVRARRRSALWLVAASLVVHLAALPPLAWLAYREAQTSRALITFETGSRPPPEPGADAPVLEPPPPVALDPDGGTLPPRDRMDNVLRRDRYALVTQGAPEGGAAADQDDPLAVRLLAARARALSGEEPRADEAALAREAGAPLERALVAALWLDRYARDGERTDGLATVLGELARTENATPAVARLVELALARARAYGLWAAPAGFDPTTVPAPRGPAWTEALRAACAETKIEHRVVDAWCRPAGD